MMRNRLSFCRFSKDENPSPKPPGPANRSMIGIAGIMEKEEFGSAWVFEVPGYKVSARVEKSLNLEDGPSVDL
jgi:hypothetical protein